MAERLGEAVLVLKTDDSRYSSAVARAETGARKLGRGLTKTGGMARRLGARLTALSGRVRALGRSFFNLRNAAILAAGVTGLAFMVKKAIDTADEISKMSAIIGISVESFQRYRFAAGQAGVSSEKFTVGLQAFGKRLGEARAGTGSLVTILKKMDPALLAQLLRTKSVEEAFRIMVTAIGNMTDQTDKMALSAAAFSRGAGLAMVNLANDGIEVIDEWGDRLERLGGILSKELIDGAVAAKDELSLFTTAIGIKITAALLKSMPAIMQLTELFINALPTIFEFAENVFVFFGEFVVPMFRAIAEAWSDFIDVFMRGIDIIDKGIATIAPTIVGFARSLVNAKKISEEGGFTFGGKFTPPVRGMSAGIQIGGFQRGGSFTVPGAGGVDSQFVPIMATPGERVTVTPEGGGDQGTRFNIDARGADLGIERRIERAMQRAVRLASAQAGGDFAAALRASGA